MADTYSGLTLSNLTLPYREWESFISANEVKFDLAQKKWLRFWTMYDLSCSPMPDAERCLIRYGSYIGWVNALDEKKHGPI
jgi:hypothetical protein